MSSPEVILNPTPRAASPQPLKQKSLGPKLFGLLFIGLLVVGGMWWILHRNKATDPKTASPYARGAMPPVPVVAGVVAVKDVPIFLDGLGTVQAFNTVTVHARVDGQLQKVAFVEGQDVRTGDLLAQIDPEPFQTAMDQAIAKKGQDEAQLANARVDLKRYEDLLAKEGVTQQVYDTQKSLVNQLEAVIKADQAAIASAKVQLAYTTIASPIDGRTGMRMVDQGNIVHANDANGVVVITQLKPISVVFTIPEQWLGEIQKASAPGGDLMVQALERDNTTVLAEGKLAVIDNQIDTATGTLRLKATFPNADLRLWPGQFVNARLLLTIRKGSLVVPASVIQRGPEGAFAFVIKEDQTVETRPVKVAQIELGEALIEDGLQAGERVVVDGQYKLQRGSKVKMADASGPGGGGERGRGQGQPPGGGPQGSGRSGKKPAGKGTGDGNPSSGKPTP